MASQPLSRLENRQRAQQAPYIDFRLVVYQVPVLLDWRMVYFLNADLSAKAAFSKAAGAVGPNCSNMGGWL
jgi:hypothetical protein